MKNFLITGIGGDIAQNIATILRESVPFTKLIGTDIKTRHAGHLFVDEVYEVPAATTKEYFDNIKELVSKYSIDIVIPTSEKELEIFQPLVEEFGEDRCITAGKKVIDIGIDKIKTINFLTSLGIEVPWTISANNSIPKNLPCIFKSKKGSGSRNLFVVENMEEALFFSRKFPDSIFQELLVPDDQEITCAVYRAKNGKVAVLQLLRELHGGSTGWAKVIDSKEVFDMCKIIANGINLYGAINIQLRLTNVGPRIFEINPRFSSTVLMRHRIGFCDLLWSISEAQGLNIDFPEIDINQSFVRVNDYRRLNN